jgi:hypothetical protein
MQELSRTHLPKVLVTKSFDGKMVTFPRAPGTWEK